MSVPRLSLAEVPVCSQFVKRSLSAMRPGASDEELMGVLSALADKCWTREDMDAALADKTDPDQLNLAMRELRRDVMVSLASRDMTGRADYFEVVRVMTALAECCISHCVAVNSRALASRFGVPMSAEGVPQDLLVVGMGKLGGAELNVSSDIDLIFIYDEDGDTKPAPGFEEPRRSLSNHEFFERLARKVIPALNDLMGPGFVFRVDMRLRPFGDEGPIVDSNGMIEEYLYAQGRDWERFAWLKGRVVNQPVFSSPEQFSAAEQYLEHLVQPFVFRRYVDFSAISSLTRLHEMIRAETQRREAGRDRGINVKLGRGGIREIEFICQTFQITRGGRNPDLRGHSTLPMLAELAKAGVLPQATTDQLAHDYVFLRNVEHALQYVDDQQTQMLPPDPAAQERIARMLGLPTAEFLERLETIRHFVAKTFDGIFHIDKDPAKADGWPAGWQVGGDQAVEGLEQKFTSLGYQDPGAVARHLATYLTGRRITARSTQAREQILRFIILAAENAPKWAQSKTGGVIGDDIFLRCLNFLEVIAGRPTYVALLNQYPSAAARVGRMLAVSRWAADYLTAHPVLLDELVVETSPITDDSPVDWSGWRARLKKRLLESADDHEQQLNLLRDAHHGALFHLLMADLDGVISVECLADQLSALADAVIGLVLEMAWPTVPNRHCETPHFAVIGYGKLGGKELSYASDLDLICLYEDSDPQAETDYIRLVRRMMSWLTVPTSSGILFDVDMRLRPNGENGLIVSSMEMFRRYQRNTDGNGAWDWEHQALTRARFCAGDPAVGRLFEDERRYILTQPRDPAKVAASVIDMRAKMLAGHKSVEGFFDVKHERGGMVDVEFIVQMLVLAYSSSHPILVNNWGNTRLLSTAADEGLIDPENAKAAAAAYRHYRNLQREIRLRLGESAPARVDPALIASDRAAVLQLWEAVFGTDAPLPPKDE